MYLYRTEAFFIITIVKVNTTIKITIVIIILVKYSLSFCRPGVFGNGFNREGGDWCGTNTLNDAKRIELLVLILVKTWCVPSSGNKYFTEKSPFATVIFSNLNNLWPFVTTTLASKSLICSPVSKFWTLNCNSVKVSIIGFSGE